MTESFPPIGSRVTLQPGHRWAGHSGAVVRYEVIELLHVSRPIVRLDDGGRECFIVHERHWRLEEGASN